MQTKVIIRKELFLAIYYNEHFSANDLKSFPLDSDEKEYLSDEYVEKKLKEMSLIGAVLSCGFDKHGDEEFSKGFMFNHIDWESWITTITVRTPTTFLSKEEVF
ncbi:hypothetical protein JCM19053_2184 [Vibrio sp. JCM 19053]|nr:hypothetical protein JCM19053_2184 [Vibrio sp. JCM 19053]